MSFTVFWQSSQENSMLTLHDNFLKRSEPEIISPYMVNMSHSHFVLRIFKTNNTADNKYILIPLYSSPKHIEMAKLQSTKSKFQIQTWIVNIKFGVWDFLDNFI